MSSRRVLDPRKLQRIQQAARLSDENVSRVAFELNAVHDQCEAQGIHLKPKAHLRNAVTLKHAAISYEEAVRLWGAR